MLTTEPKIKNLELSYEQMRKSRDAHAETASDLNVTLSNLLGPIQEIDVLVSLLGIAQRAADNVSPNQVGAELFGCDLATLNAIVVRRVRALARRCRDDLNVWNYPSPVEARPGYREADEYEAPEC